VKFSLARLLKRDHAKDENAPDQSFKVTESNWNVVHRNTRDCIFFDRSGFSNFTYAFLMCCFCMNAASQMLIAVQHLCSGTVAVAVVTFSEYEVRVALNAHIHFQFVQKYVDSG
jgi:hypothetical protein